MIDRDDREITYVAAPIWSMTRDCDATVKVKIGDRVHVVMDKGVRHEM